MSLEQNVSRAFENPIFRSYMRDIAQYPLLTPEQEREFGEGAKAGDKNAINELILGNLRLVVSIALKFNYNGDVMDLIQAGNNALRQYAKKYSPELGSCGEYLSPCIRGLIMRERAYDRNISVPINELDLYNKVKKIKERHMNQHGVEPDYKEIAKILGVYNNRTYSPKELIATFRRCESVGTVPLEESVGDEGQNNETREVANLANSDGRDMTEIYEKETLNLVRDKISTIKISDKAKRVLRGILIEGRTQEEIAYEMGCKYQNIGQIYYDNIPALRRALSGHYEESYGHTRPMAKGKRLS